MTALKDLITSVPDAIVWTAGVGSGDHSMLKDMSSHNYTGSNVAAPLQNLGTSRYCKNDWQILSMSIKSPKMGL